MNTKSLYTKLISKKEKDVVSFINKISIDKNHLFWGACRDFAREILSKDMNWKWLGKRVDDFALEAQKVMQKKLQKWLFKALLGSSKMRIDSLENLIFWLFDRYVAELKNLFDSRSKNFIDIAKIDSLIIYLTYNQEVYYG